MSLIGALTTVGGLVADFGITSLIGNVVATCTTKSGNKMVDKICIAVGTAVVAGMAGEAAQKYIERKSQEIQDTIKEGVNLVKKEEDENGGEEVSE